MNNSIQGSYQQISVALNEGATNYVNDLDKKSGNKESAQEIDDRSHIAKFLDKKSEAKAGKDIISDLADKIAASGIDLNSNSTNKINGKIQDEYDLMLKGRENTEDAVHISDSNKISKAGKSGNQKGDGNEQNNGSKNPAEINKLLQEYPQAVIQSILSNSAEATKKKEEIELKLKQNGVSEKEIKELQRTIKNSIRADISKIFKEETIKKLITNKTSIDWALSARKISNTFDKALGSDKLGNWDFGGYNEHLQGTFNNAMADARAELKSFLPDEIERALVSDALKETKPDGKEVNKLLELGGKVGIDFDQVLKNWKNNSIDIGLVPVPYGGNIPTGAGTGSNMGNDKQKTGYEFSIEDEKELLINQLRALYMSRAVKGDLKTVIETSFKIRKLKNGIIKLGISFADLDKIQKEGTALAKVKTMEMLNEALYERATLYELSGPAFQLVESRIKGVMKNLNRLGITPTAAEFDEIKNQANQRMFEEAEIELQRAKAVFAIKPSPKNEKKILLLTKLLIRLNEESNLRKDFDISGSHDVRAKA